MKDSDTLVQLCEGFNIPVHVFRDCCSNAKITNGVPTMELIDKGAVPSDFAGYLKVNGINYEPCQFEDARWLDEGTIGMQSKIPVAYVERGNV